MRRWEEILPEAERRLYQSFTLTRQSFGIKLAFLIVDVNMSFIGSRPMPVLQAVKEYVTSCGEVGWAAVANIRKLLDACRAKNIPVIFTTGDPVTWRFCPGVGKMAKPREALDLRAEEIPEAIAPLPSELVIRKFKASAFFETPLLAYLRFMKINSLLITGATTSGCVRATVVDASSHDFPCFVVEECVFDRFELSHLVNLFDMNTKYADVISLEEALTRITHEIP